MKKKQSIALILIIATAMIVTYFTLEPKDAPHSELVFLKGDRQNISDLKGKVILVNFWATSCTTCVAEMPDLIALHKKLSPSGFEVIGITMQYDPPSYVVNFAESRQIPFQVAIDNTGQIAQEWGNVQITPTSFIVDKQGKIIKTFVGPPDFKGLENTILQLLKS